MSSHNSSNLDQYGSPAPVPHKSVARIQTSAISTYISHWGDQIVSAHEEKISHSDIISIRCTQGHTRNTNIYNIKVCSICRIMSKLGSGIVSKQQEYDEGVSTFIFRCSLGHMFTANLQNGKGCKSCKLEAGLRVHGMFNLRLDTKCLNIRNTSRLRLHCGETIHNPACSSLECVAAKNTPNRDYAITCTNHIPCNKDFYATVAQLKYPMSSVFNCSKNHWNDGADYAILNCLRVFETIFDCQFDDTMFDMGYEFSGYNAKQGIAFVHLSDPCSKYIRSIIAWCMKCNIALVVVPRNLNSTSEVLRHIVDKLDEQHLLDSAPDAIYGKVRSQLTQLRQKGIFFRNRI